LNSAIGWATAVGVCVLAATSAAWAQGAAPEQGAAQRPPVVGAKGEGARGEGARSDGARSDGDGAEDATGRTGSGAGDGNEVLVWSAAEIEAAEAHCSVLLRGIDVVAVREAPIREGTACGAAAPMKLLSIGKSPKIVLSPPPTVTCDLIAALYKWLQHDVQALARSHLGAPVVRIDTMSSYSCRNAYGRVNGRLSEHARANALDIRAFATAGGQTIHVAADWGPTGREITAAARAAVTKAPAEKPAAKRTAGGGQVASPGPAPPPQGTQQPAAVLLVPGLAMASPGGGGLALPQPLAQPSSLWQPSLVQPSLAMSPPSRLGGPKAQDTALPSEEKTDFLRAAHRAACRIFGTVLGPEANNAHKNHFHLDMAERKVIVICE
jgi:hypothetical protein